MTTLLIKHLSRTAGQSEEVLKFSEGVNLLIGSPNTGKTKWLEMLDYLMAETASPEVSFGEALAQKYQQIEALISIGGIDFVIKRRWNEPGLLGKVFVNDTPMVATDFSNFLLERLQLPMVRFPIGTRWPQVGWRTLFRHIYRQQRYWADLADKQPKQEQHACLMVFLGLAEHLFPKSRSDLATAQERRAELEMDRRRFSQILDDISHELLDTEPGAAVTDEVLGRALAAGNRKISELANRREAIADSISRAVVDQGTVGTAQMEELDAQWANLQRELEERTVALGKVDGRISELQAYFASVENELARINRAFAAGEQLSPLKVTMCPVCQQSVTSKKEKSGHCFLCEQELPSTFGVDANGRLDFELGRLTAEIDEVHQQLRELHAEREKAETNLSITREQFGILEGKLRPYRAASAAIVPPELSALDVEIGRIEEQIRQMNRMRKTLSRRDQLGQEIDELSKTINELEMVIAQHEAEANLVAAGNSLDSGMNEYLNLLNEVAPSAWNQGRIDVSLSESSFDLFVGNGRWSNKLGGTMTLYFLLAYHFGLIRLTGDPNRRYPGICILDLPPQLDEAAVVEMEASIVQPFLDLSTNGATPQTQIILTGSSFEGIRDANRLELTQVWK